MLCPKKWVKFIFIFSLAVISCGGGGGGGNNPASSTSKQMTAFGFKTPASTGIIDESAKTVTVTVPYGTDITSLASDFTTTGIKTTVNGVEQESGVTTNNFSGVVTYRVTAEDGSFTDYNITVNIAPADSKDITAFSITGQSSSDINGTDITVIMPYGTVRSSLVPTITHTGAGISPESGIAQDFTNPLKYTVTAADGSKKEYTVTVIIAEKTVITLGDDLTDVGDGILTPSEVRTANLNDGAVRIPEVVFNAVDLPAGTTLVYNGDATNPVRIRIVGNVSNVDFDITDAVIAFDGIAGTSTVDVNVPSTSPFNSVYSVMASSTGAGVTVTSNGTVKTDYNYNDEPISLSRTLDAASNELAPVGIGPVTMVYGTTSNPNYYSYKFTNSCYFDYSQFESGKKYIFNGVAGVDRMSITGGAVDNITLIANNTQVSFISAVSNSTIIGNVPVDWSNLVLAPFDKVPVVKTPAQDNTNTITVTSGAKIQYGANAPILP